MPELPEVETIRRELKSLVLNKTIKVFQVKDRIFLKKPKSLSGWKKILSCKIKDVQRKGKFLVFSLNKNLKIVVHLRMSGQLLYGNKSDSKVRIVFSDSTSISYFDKRRFGEWFLIKEDKEIPLLHSIGVDPLGKYFSIQVLKGLLTQRNTNMHNFLLNQRMISGIGNIYANEILYRAKLSPFRKTGSLKGNEIEILYYAIKEILNKALKARGSSIDTYLDIWGNPGKYSYQHIVYGKEGEFCPHCPSKIVRGKLNNRSIYYCPGCQQ